MNDERQTRARDELVSRTYREHSTEHAPEHLNRKILAMAADKSPRIGKLQHLFRSWTRPLALAATIALSFAIVLEVTRLPEPISTPSVPASTATDSLREEFRQKDSALVKRAQDQARLRDGSNRTDSLIAEPQSALKLDEEQDLAANSAAEAPAAANIATIAEAESVPDSRDRSERSQPSRRVQAPVSDMDDAGAGQAPVLGQTAARFSAAVEKKESADPASCNTKERESAESWLACIDALKRDGATAEAESEYAEYILKFPVE